MIPVKQPTPRQYPKTERQQRCILSMNYSAWDLSLPDSIKRLNIKKEQHNVFPVTFLNNCYSKQFCDPCSQGIWPSLLLLVSLPEHEYLPQGSQTMLSTLLAVDKETFIIREISAEEMKWFGSVPSFLSLTNALQAAPATALTLQQTALNYHSRLHGAKRHHATLQPPPLAL